MSRKSREDNSSWKTPSIYAFVGDYAPLRTKGYEPIENALVWLDFSRDGDERHAMYSYAGQAQEILIKNNESSPDTPRTILVVDVKDMFDSKDEYQEALKKEIEDPELTKGFGKKLLRLGQRLLLTEAIVAAQDQFCCVLIKL